MIVVFKVVIVIEMVVMKEVDREVAMVSDQVTKGLKRIWTITPLPAQISAYNFHDLTQITQHRVCINLDRTHSLF